ncbi:MAG TPA: hypothetical protein VF546_13765 [Pyrinomonadaceae bacterium]|jgi:hypothetical protein
MREPLKDSLRPGRGLWAAVFVLCAAVCAAAQSPDLEYPTPVYANEITGRVAPRDLGDPRLTSHFYTFNGAAGDLLLTIESENLDGAVDLFLANGLRPLAQATLYATGSALNTSKTVFLRREGALVLRVQARTPNDADGTYRIRLGGTFAPSTAVAAAPSEPEATAASRAPARGTHRVNAVGARIEEPTPPAPEPSAAEAQPTEESAPAPTPTPRRQTSARRNTPRRTRQPTRTETARRPAPSRTDEPAPPTTTETPTETPTGGEEAANTETPAPRPTPTPRNSRTGRNTRGGRTRESARRTNEPAPAGEPPAAGGTEAPTPVPQLGLTRLVIEARDGTKVEHEMSAVSRVTVVNQLIVVVLKNGRIERYPLANVLRMAIEP